jgi:hypothetical protein
MLQRKKNANITFVTNKKAARGGLGGLCLM